MHRSMFRGWFFVAGGVAVGIAGFVLVLTAPFDNAAQTGLGSALITGMIVGLALSAIQWTMEDRRTRLEREREEERRQAMYNRARSQQLSALLAAHIWTYWQLLLPHLDKPLIEGPPAGFHEEDARRTHQALQWLRELMGADPCWWQNTTLLVTADAISYVATDLLDRLYLQVPPDESDDSENQQAMTFLLDVRTRTLDRLAGTAERLGEAGDVERAFELDGYVDAFESGVMPTYAPDLGALRTTDGVEVLWRPLEPVREEVSWLVDRLRPDPMSVNEYGQPLHGDVPPPSAYRWGRVFDADDDPLTAWDERFAEDSWLRRIYDRAGRELPKLFRLDLGSLDESGRPVHHAGGIGGGGELTPS